MDPSMGRQASASPSCGSAIQIRWHRRFCNGLYNQGVERRGRKPLRRTISGAIIPLDRQNLNSLGRCFHRSESGQRDQQRTRF